MLNYWWMTRPKRKLDSIPDVLATFAGISLDQEWRGHRNTQLSYEEALEEAGLKRVGSRRDQSGSGGRTYGAWLRSLGLIFTHAATGNIKLTLAGEAIMDGRPPTAVLKAQILKYQFPSAYSISRGVNVNERFRIHPFWFLFRLIMDERIGYLTQSEIARIVIVEAEKETNRCFEYIVERVCRYREEGDACLADNFFELYKPGRGEVNREDPYHHLEDIANTIMNWMEYTQLARRNADGQLEILPEASEEVRTIVNSPLPFIERPDNEEYFQRKYGLDPWHQRDNRNLEQTRTITTRVLAEMKVKQAYVNLSLRRPIMRITQELVSSISEETGIIPEVVEEVLTRNFPHGSIGSFMASYFEMAFSGRDEAIDFEIATTDIFSDVFGYDATHLGQMGNLSAPDILLLSDSEGYQAIIDNKAYARYTITGDHHNRMVHNYIAQIGTYSDSAYPIGFFSYIAGGFGDSIDRQIRDEADESGVHGSGITVSRFIQMIEKQNENGRYTHNDLRRIFSVDRQVLEADL